MHPVKKSKAFSSGPSDLPNLGRLCLGTAALGMEYGVTNENGPISFGEFGQILDLCRSAGVRGLDTAQNYGKAEEMLGRLGVSDLFITTKMTLLETENADAVLEKTLASLQRLQVEKVDGMLLHNEERLTATDRDAVASALQKLKTLGLVGKVGISSYEPALALELCERHGFDLVQLPVNVLDTRLLQNDYFQKFQDAGVEVQARSVFLQGLLLAGPLPGKGVPREVEDQAEAFRARCRKEGVTPLEAALGYVLGLADGFRVVFGVSSLRELEQILQAAGSPRVLRQSAPVTWRREFDPRFWKS